jgi:hypothetical protein
VVDRPIVPMDRTSIRCSRESVKAARSAAGGLAACNGGTTADQSTDENGQTFWLQPLRAGGCSVGEMTMVLVAGTPLVGPGLPVVFRGPDLNGDLAVNLSDIVRTTVGIGATCS